MPSPQDIRAKYWFYLNLTYKIEAFSTFEKEKFFSFNTARTFNFLFLSIILIGLFIHLIFLVEYAFF